ncbi:MAG: phosphatidate cytidylyltransferase [Bacteroidota bacterium]
MKKHIFTWSLLVTLLLGLSSCEAIGSIFKAGVWTGFIIVAIIIGIIVFVISRAGKNK